MTVSYLDGQKHCGLKPGDKVRVLRTATNGEGGWDNTWTPPMNKTVDNVYTVKSLSRRTARGVRLVGDGIPNGKFWRFPYFVLQKVEEGEGKAVLDSAAGVGMCTCDMMLLMRQGCTCGAMQKERGE